MVKLPVPRGPVAPTGGTRPLGNPDRPGSGSGNESRAARLASMMDRLEGLQQTARENPEMGKMLAPVIAELREFVAEEMAHAGPAAPAASPASASKSGLAPVPAQRDSVQVVGDVKPGAVAGGGKSTIYGDAAGGDIINGGVDVLVRYADKVIFADSETARKAGISEQEKDYLLWLSVTASRIPLGNFEQQMTAPDQVSSDVRLGDIYVPLDSTWTEQALQRDNQPSGRVPVSLLAAVARNRRLIVLGDPGSGKTTFLNFLTLCLVGARLYPDKGFLERLNVPSVGRRRAANWLPGAVLPVRIDLREFAHGIPEGTRRGNAKLLWNHIDSQLTAHGLEDFIPAIHSAMRGKPGCLVMLDGLDEIADKKRRQLVREALTDFADSHQRNRFLVTCRVLSYNDPAWQLRGFPEVTVAPLEKTAIQTFIDKWYEALARRKHISREVAHARARELRTAVSNLIDLAQNPMLLTVMSVVHTYKGTLPRERARLYNDCVQLLLWEWQRTKQVAPDQWEIGIVEELDTREERLINGLCEVAYRAHGAQGGHDHTPMNIPQAELLRILKKYLGGDYGKAQRFCEYVEQRAGLLIAKGQDESGEPVYAFPHRGFQEFLAARHIVADRDFERLAARLAADGDIWHEVLLLAVGHLIYNQEDVNRPINAMDLLCPPEPPKHAAAWRAVWWAGEMLLIVGRGVTEQDEFIGKRVVPRLLKYLVMLVDGGHLSVLERALAADTLGQLGDPRPGVCTVEPEMIPIPGGAFQMGPDDDQHKVTLKPFKIARCPVTNAQFRLFVTKKGYEKDKYWTKAGLEWRNRAGRTLPFLDDAVWGIDNRPVVSITWHEAVAYTNWLREKTKKPYRLLTEAEWERAAAGLERRKYPFGNRASDDQVNTRECGIGQTTGVGIFPDDKTPEGVYDLGGNVWEWTSSLARDYPYKPSDGREDLDASGPRILRGGGYDSQHRQMHCALRRPVEAHARVPLIGFRLGMDGG